MGRSPDRPQCCRNRSTAGATLHSKSSGSAGAWVEATAVISGRQVTLTRHNAADHSYGNPDPRTHFGLGDATKVDRLRIEWPSGTVQELRDVQVRQILTVTESLPTEIRIHRQPESLTVPPGYPAKLFARVSGPQPLSYQWRRGGVEIPGSGQLWFDQMVWNQRVRDGRRLLDALAEWNESDPVLAQRIDLEAIGAVGFSLGGEAAAQLGRSDPRVRAVTVVGVEPLWCYDLDASAVNKPLLLALEATLEDASPTGDISENPAYRLFNLSPGPAYYLRIGGTMHHSLTGVMRIVAPEVAGGATENRRAAGILNACMVAFFNRHLLGREEPLLDDPTESFPELAAFRRK